VQVGILGPLIVTDGARPIEIGGARLRALFIRLAVDAGSWVSVSELVEALWESDPPGGEVNALQSLVSRLRRAVPVPDVLQSGPAGYRLAVDPEAVDGLRFGRLAVEGRRQLTAGAAATAFTVLTEALGLWRGTPLVEVSDAQYAQIRVERLTKQRLTAVEDRAAAGLQLDRHQDLIAELEEITTQHPLRERSHELLIRALAGLGRQGEALAVYDRLGRSLADELGLDPPIHLQHLQTAVLRNDPQLLADGNPTASSAAGPDRPRRTNLRSQLTSFVGREQELRQVGALIERSRLVTLVGTGGAGKTRLAGEVADRLNGRGSDGVWMVELAPVTEPDDVASTALGSLGTLEQQILERPALGHRDALSRLIESLADKDVVLILDNCEHLLDAAAKLAEHLLGQCPRLTVLATSREPLGIVGESLWPVLPLPTPELEDGMLSATSTAAVQLFIDRAALVRPGFQVTPENAGSVAEICRRLDGLPLAIELAAARLRNLTVEAVAARLVDRFRLLTGGNRTAMPRQQTLRAVVAWSWDLLTENERRLAARLSVFPGGATGETAAVVCTGDPADPDWSEDVVADLLLSLADKSLLVVVETSERHDDGAQPRYRMLETIREFATERLAERGELTQLRAAHGRYFLELAETAEPRLRSAEQLSWLDRLTAERDNLLATLRFAVETADADTAFRLGAALSWYWTLLGRHDQAANWLEQVINVPGERPAEPYAIVFVLHTISAAAAGFGIPDEQVVDEMLEVISGLDLMASHPLLTLVEPGIAMLRDRGEPAKAALDRNLAHPDPWARAMLHLMGAVVAENDGDIEALMEHMPLALNGFREIGDRWGIGTSIGTLANVYSARGEVEEAISALEEARRMMTELHATDDESYALSRIGMLRMRRGDLTAARKDLETAIQIGERIGSASSTSSGTLGLATLAHLEGRTDEARRLADEALAQFERAPFAPGQLKAVICCTMATFDIAEGALDAAVERLTEAYAKVMETMDMPIATVLAVCLADLALARGNSTRSAELLGASVRIRGMEDLSDPDLKRVVATTRSELSPEEYDRSYARGKSLSRETALAQLEAELISS
jgi:predicted ATPase/DNA-binding SARP family transcriptional activator